MTEESRQEMLQGAEMRLEAERTRTLGMEITMMLPSKAEAHATLQRNPHWSEPSTSQVLALLVVVRDQQERILALEDAVWRLAGAKR